MNKERQFIPEQQLDPPKQYVEKRRLTIDKMQQGAKINKPDFKKNVKEFDNTNSTKQDNTSRKQTPVDKPVDEPSYVRDQGEIKSYDKSPREKLMSQAYKLGSVGNGALTGIVSQPILSATRLMRPDNYVRDIKSGTDFGNRLLQFGTDVATVAPAVNAVSKYLNKRPMNTAVGADPNKTYMSLDDIPGEQYGKSKMDLVRDKSKKVLDQSMQKKFLPIGEKQYLPNNIKFEQYQSNNLGNFGVRAVDDTGKKWGGIDLSANQKDWTHPNLIDIDKKMQGNRMQDVLYDLGAKASQERGFKGIKSGGHLLSPAKTIKAHSRMNYESLGKTITNTPGEEFYHDIAGITGSKNPNVTTDWLNKYSSMNKNLGREKLSVQDVYRKLTNKPKLEQGVPLDTRGNAWGSGNWNTAPTDKNSWATSFSETLKPIK